VRRRCEIQSIENSVALFGGSKVRFHKSAKKPSRDDSASSLNFVFRHDEPSKVLRESVKAFAVTESSIHTSPRINTTTCRRGSSNRFQGMESLNEKEEDIIIHERTSMQC